MGSKKVEKEIFAFWLSLPEVIRHKLLYFLPSFWIEAIRGEYPDKFNGSKKPPEIKNEVDFAKFFEVGDSSLWRWKNSESFWKQVEGYRGVFYRGKIADVIEAIYQNALAGNPQSQKLFLEAVGKHPTRVELSGPDGEAININGMSYEQLIAFLDRETQKADSTTKDGE